MLDFRYMIILAKIIYNNDIIAISNHEFSGEVSGETIMDTSMSIACNNHIF